MVVTIWFIKIVGIAIMLMGIQDCYHTAYDSYQQKNYASSVVYWFFCVLFIGVIIIIVFK